MKYQLKWLSGITALAATLFVGGCENATLMEPQLEPAAMEVLSTSGKKFVVAYEQNPESATVSQVIGPRGGVLGIGQHLLYVQSGTVDKPTLFTMTRAPETALRVKLTAGEDNAVGAAGFKKPVRLALSLSHASNIPEGEERKNAKILYYLNDGLAEELPSTVYGSLVVADLWHFSLYGIGWP